ncbi:hypothetical protein GBFDFA_08230 [Edwardsiella anguillarum]|nr:hypothetical protein PBOPBF_08235 [Edwardsiella anguillarum]BET84112.1 hypothetical protein GHNJMD_08545 [Edwardsiella anguillarum]BET87478.1 hypothetical protein GBFDFA_08230 [Edwardsiella anguillarum]BET90905.1 hypothetical protein BIKEJJ_08240 [Edwardsiella anguillarum]
MPCSLIVAYLRRFASFSVNDRVRYGTRREVDACAYRVLLRLTLDMWAACWVDAGEGVDHFPLTVGLPSVI